MQSIPFRRLLRIYTRYDRAAGHPPRLSSGSVRLQARVVESKEKQHTAQNITRFAASQVEFLSKPLEYADPLAYDLIRKERGRDQLAINLVPSANYTSKSVLSATGSVIQNPNSEGYLGSRYFPGTEHMDDVERLCQQRALQAFGLDESVWGVNVQTYSYELAMLQACSAILAPHDRLLTIQMPNKCRRLYKYFTTVAHDGHFRWSKDSLQIDSRSLEELANVYKPRLVAVPSKCFGHFVDLGTINTISHKGGAYVLVDITETSGLIVAGILASPFKYADIVICGTQGSLCGPRAALIFFRKSMRVRSVDSKITTTISTRNDQLEVDLEQAVHASVFPRHQGGPHNHAIMATAVALAQCQTATFRSSQKLALTNAAALMDRMRELGYDVRGGDSPSYELVIKIGDGSHSRMKLDRAILDGAHITVDDTAATTNEERHLLHLGTNATTSRGFSPPDYYDVAGFIDRALTIAKEMHCSQNHDKARSEVMSLRREVNDWTSKFEALYGFEQT